MVIPNLTHFNLHIALNKPIIEADIIKRFSLAWIYHEHLLNQIKALDFKSLPFFIFGCLLDDFLSVF